MNAKEYKIDFTIPRGITGPTGPIANEPNIYVTYNPSSTNGNLMILNTFKSPPDSSLFTSDDEYIYFTDTGYFQYTLTGTIKETNTNLGANVILKTQNTNGFSNNLISIELQAGTKEIFFSQIKMGEYGSLQKVAIIFQKNGNSDALLENVSLNIKRFSFQKL